MSDTETSRIKLLHRWREQELAEYDPYLTDADGNVVATKDFIDCVYDLLVKLGWPVVRDVTGRLQVVKPHKH